MPVAARSIGLPHLNERTTHRSSILIPHASMHEDAFARSLPFVLRSQIVIIFANQLVSKDRPGSLRKRFRLQYQRHARRSRNRRYIRWKVEVRLCSRNSRLHCGQFDQTVLLYTRSIANATPCPTPTHIVASASLPPCFSN